MKSSPEELAGYRHGVERIHGTWQAFLDKQVERLEQQSRHGVAAERVAENILEDLFTQVLGWSLADLNNQVRYADLLLSRSKVKHLLQASGGAGLEPAGGGRWAGWMKCWVRKVTPLPRFQVYSGFSFPIAAGEVGLWEIT